MKGILSKALLVVVAALALFAGILYAASLVNVPSDITIVAPPQTSGIEVYVDAACTQPLTALHWGTEIRAGSTSQFVAYVKNVGTNLSMVSARADNITSWGTFSALNVSLLPNSSMPMTLNLAISPLAPLGQKTFTLIFEATP
jgi:hypothetical protein